MLAASGVLDNLPIGVECQRLGVEYTLLVEMAIKVASLDDLAFVLDQLWLRCV